MHFYRPLPDPQFLVEPTEPRVVTWYPPRDMLRGELLGSQENRLGAIRKIEVCAWSHQCM